MHQNMQKREKTLPTLLTVTWSMIIRFQRFLAHLFLTQLVI